MAQTITWNTNIEGEADRLNTSIYLFEDSNVIDIASDLTTVSDSDGNPTLIISDVNSGNATLHTGVETPEDYYGWKYTYADSTWTAVVGWVDPRLEEEE